MIAVRRERMVGGTDRHDMDVAPQHDDDTVGGVVDML